MRSRSARHHLIAALALAGCAGSELPLPPRPDMMTPAVHSARALPAAASTAHAAAPAVSAGVDGGVPPVLADPSNPSSQSSQSSPSNPSNPSNPAPDEHCAGVPPLDPDGSAPAPPPHAPLGEELAVPGDRAAYVLPGNAGDPRLIVYLHGMCGDVTAPDHFREALRERGTLLALRGDTPCSGERFKWRDDSSKIHQRLRVALEQLNQQRGLQLSLEGVILFGYSQGADRAEKLAQYYPKLFPRVVLGGPPMRASPLKLARARRVAILGGELETTENMRQGAEALQAAGIACRYFTLECAYHGWYGTRAEQQLSEVLAWVGEP